MKKNKRKSFFMKYGFMTVLFLSVILLFTPSSVFADCRTSGCKCTGTWDPSWQGNAQNNCLGTVCWYAPDGSGGCPGHAWYFYRTIRPASCEEDGKMEYRCSTCAGFYYQETEATGHSWSNWKKNDENTHSRSCRNGGEVEIEDHSFGEWTSGVDGYQHRTCSVCKYEEKDANIYYIEMHDGYPAGVAGNGNEMEKITLTYDEERELPANTYGFSYQIHLEGNPGNSASIPEIEQSDLISNAVFKGWADSNTGKARFSDQEKIKNLSIYQYATVNLYAKWKMEEVTLPQASRDGFSFAGWYTEDGNKVGDAGSHYTPAKDITLYAHWEDKEGPKVLSFTAEPKEWEKGTGLVSLKAEETGAGFARIHLTRIYALTGSEKLVGEWYYGGETTQASIDYTEEDEGIFYYNAELTDQYGNTTTVGSDAIYLDHSDPVIFTEREMENVWTNQAPQIKIRATDYLFGTSQIGSGVKIVEIRDEDGNLKAEGTDAAMYTVASVYEGRRTWYLIARDQVGHRVMTSITTCYDMTPPTISGNHAVSVSDEEGDSVYSQDKVIQLTISDSPLNSERYPNASSGLKSVIMYRVKDGEQTIIDTPETRKTFEASESEESFLLVYDTMQDEADYYLVIAEDFAGNRVSEKVTMQGKVLEMFHTSIER